MKAYLLKAFVLMTMLVPATVFAVYPGDQTVVREIRKIERLQKMRTDPSMPESFTDDSSGTVERLVRYLLLLAILAGFFFIIRSLVKRIRASGVRAGEQPAEEGGVDTDDEPGGQADVPVSVRARDAYANGRYEDAIRILYRGLAMRLLILLESDPEAHRTDGEILLGIRDGSVLHDTCLTFFTEAQRLLFGEGDADEKACSRLMIAFEDIQGCLNRGDK